MKYIVDMNLEVEETMALNVERSNSTNHNLPNSTKEERLHESRYLRPLFFRQPARRIY